MKSVALGSACSKCKVPSIKSTVPLIAINIKSEYSVLNDIKNCIADIAIESIAHFVDHLAQPWMFCLFHHIKTSSLKHSQNRGVTSALKG